MLRLFLFLPRVRPILYAFEGFVCKHVEYGAKMRFFQRNKFTRRASQLSQRQNYIAQHARLISFDVSVFRGGRFEIFVSALLGAPSKRFYRGPKVPQVSLSSGSRSECFIKSLRSIY